MQILSDEGYEDQITKGLGIIPGKIKKFSNKKLIIPHMGWNTVSINKKDTIIKNNLNEKDFYFVHSYIYENINKENMKPRQSLPKVYIRSGSIYLFERNVLLKQKSMVGKKCYGIILSGKETINIDTYENLNEFKNNL